MWLWQSKFYQQNQNYADNILETLKHETNCLLDSHEAPQCFELLTLMMYIFCHNYTTVGISIGDDTRSPYMLSTGCGDNISNLLFFVSTSLSTVLLMLRDRNSCPNPKQVTHDGLESQKLSGFQWYGRSQPKRLIRFSTNRPFNLLLIRWNVILAWIRWRTFTSN